MKFVVMSFLQAKVWFGNSLAMYITSIQGKGETKMKITCTTSHYCQRYGFGKLCKSMGQFSSLWLLVLKPCMNLSTIMDSFLLLHYHVTWTLSLSHKNLSPKQELALIFINNGQLILYHHYYIWRTLDIYIRLDY